LPQRRPSFLFYRLDGFRFKSGEKYAEFTQGDKIAKYGLTALIAGGAGAAATKFGIFKFLGKFGKAIFLAIFAFFAAIWGKIKGIFKRTNKNI